MALRLRESRLHSWVPVLLLAGAGLLVALSASPRGDVPNGVEVCGTPLRR